MNKQDIKQWFINKNPELKANDNFINNCTETTYECFNDLQPPSSGMTVTVLATELAEAVAKDEANGEGFDMSAGMYGINVSDWIREVALVITETSKQRPTALQPQWVSVDDRLPINSNVLTRYETVRVIATDGVISGEMDFSAGTLPGPWFEWSEYGDFDPDKITHWQPLPLPPSEGE